MILLKMATMLSCGKNFQCGFWVLQLEVYLFSTFIFKYKLYFFMKRGIKFEQQFVIN